jgi:hypothetical protein
MIMENIETLAGKVATLVGVVDDHELAIAMERAAEAALLERVVAEVRPALRAICGKIQRGHRWWQQSTPEAGEEARWFTERGVWLDGGLEKDCPQANDGAYGGDGLYLLEDGHFARVRYSGNWSRWQATSSEWQAELGVLDLDSVVKQYDVEPLVDVLLAAIDKQLATRPDRTKAARERAATLAAVTTLLNKK